MGYSASFTCKSPKAMDEMLAFMATAYRDPHAVGLTIRSRFTGIVSGGGVKYGGGSRQVGFNSPGAYEYALIRWMALRVGMHRRFTAARVKLPVPWVNDDDTRTEPILLRSVFPDPLPHQEHWLVDEHGFRPQERWWKLDDPMADRFEAEYTRQDTLIQAELRRLTEQWSKR